MAEVHRGKDSDVHAVSGLNGIENPRLVNLSTTSCESARHMIHRAIACWITKHNAHSAFLIISLATLKWLALDWRLFGIVSFHIEMAVHFSTEKGICIAIVHCYMYGPSSIQISMKVPLDINSCAHCSKWL